MPRKQWPSIIFGVIVSLAVAGIPALLLSTIYTPFILLVFLAIPIFLSGLVNVPTGYFGVIKRLQRRIGVDILENAGIDVWNMKWERDNPQLGGEKDKSVEKGSIEKINDLLEECVLKEGWYWVIPVIETVDLVNIKLRTSEVKKMVGGKEEAPSVLCKDGTVRPAITYQWRIQNTPLGVLQILTIDPSTVLEGVNDAILSSFATMAENTGTQEVRTTFRSNKIKRKLFKEISKRIENWFVEVEMPNIVDITLDPEVEKAINKRAIEKEEKLAETTQAEFLLEQARNLVNASRPVDENGNPIGAPTMTLDEAIRRLQLDREKPGVQEIAVTGNASDSLAGAAAIVARAVARANNKSGGDQ